MEGQLAGVISPTNVGLGIELGIINQSWWQMTTYCAIPPAPQLQLLIKVLGTRGSVLQLGVATSQPTP